MASSVIIPKENVPYNNVSTLGDGGGASAVGNPKKKEARDLTWSGVNFIANGTTTVLKDCWGEVGIMYFLWRLTV